jgi:cystathionine beta-lyase
MKEKPYDFDELVDRLGTGAYKYDLRQKVFGTEDVIPMWVADMDFRTPDFIMKAIRKRTRHEVLGYTFRTDSFYKAIKDWVWQRYRWKIEKEWIVFCPGVVPGINMGVLAFTSPGDRIIIQPPVYFPFFSAVTSHKRVLFNNQLRFDGSTYTFNLDDLRKKADGSARMLILSSPHNPVSRSWTVPELEAVASICMEKNILILSDEIHADLTFPPHKHTPLASLSPSLANLVVTFMAPSKTFNLAGLSTSYLIIPNAELRKKYNHMQESLHMELGNIFGFVALEAAYTDGMRWLNEMLEYTWKNISFVDHYLKKNIPRITMIPAEATYLLWLDCRKLSMDPEKLNRFFIEKAHLGLSEGQAFGPGGEGFMRMNVACPLSVVEKAMHQLENAVRSVKS